LQHSRFAAFIVWQNLIFSICLFCCGAAGDSLIIPIASHLTQYKNQQNQQHIEPGNSGNVPINTTLLALRVPTMIILNVSGEGMTGTLEL